jgi:D-beta-D-heptose 7-phosphate kinase/D-beta-D-heptose 1-phosphate adenosyltransferase
MFLVIGDFILDEFCYGRASRISPEAPNLILDLEEIKRIRGGAYNVVEHLRSLDNKVYFVSVVGEKNISQFDINNLFNKDDEIIYDANRLRTVKSRMVARYRHTTLLRVDQEENTEISDDQEDRIIAIIKKIISIKVCEGICIVDYCKGVITRKISTSIIDLARKHMLNTYIDTKSRDIEKFSGAYMLKPNKNEFNLLKSLSVPEGSSDEFFCKYLYESLKIENIVRTLGENGVELYSKGVKVIDVKGHACDIKELSGAGDSLLAATAHLHRQGMPLSLAVEKANKAASIFVSNGVDYRILKSDLN